MVHAVVVDWRLEEVGVDLEPEIGTLVNSVVEVYDSGVSLLSHAMNHMNHRGGVAVAWRGMEGFGYHFGMLSAGGSIVQQCAVGYTKREA